MWLAEHSAHARHACSTIFYKARRGCAAAQQSRLRPPLPPLLLCNTKTVLQAIIEGFDISRDMDSVYALMGACPQHDLLWDGLTGEPPVGVRPSLQVASCGSHVLLLFLGAFLTCCTTIGMLCTGREHLLFYARIKNLRGKALRRAVDDGLRAVNLFSVGDDLVGGYR